MVKGGAVVVFLMLAQVVAVGCGGSKGNDGQGSGGQTGIGGSISTGQGGAGGQGGGGTPYGWVDRSGAFYTVNAIWGDSRYARRRCVSVG